MASRDFLTKAYLAYFGRPVDFDGLQYWSTKTDAEVIAGFSASNESKSLYGSEFNAAQVNAIYNILFGRDAEPNGLTYWTNEVYSGRLKPLEAALGILNGAANADKTAVENKLASSKLFTDGLDTTAEILGYSGTAAANAARAFLQTVTTTPATQTQVDQAVANVSASGGGLEGQTFTLTAGIDNVPGTNGNDIINATETTGQPRVFGGLDVIDGGAGNDTLNAADSLTTAGNAFTFGGATIKNVEIINVSTNGKFDGLDVSSFAGLTTFNATSADTAAATITAADTTDVKLTTATTNASTVTGGKAVSVIKGAAAAGTLGITGKGLTEVTVKGGAGAVTIDNLDAAGTTSVGTTLKSVTLDGVDAATEIKGKGTESVTVTGATTAARTVTVTNSTANHALTVNVDGTGYTAAGAAAQTVVVDANSKIITVNATGAKSSLALTGSSATTVNVTGSADLTLASLASATTLDASAATGNLTLGDLNAATVTVSTGAGKDTLAIQATAKATVSTGAGDDVVTLKSALAAGSTINLGAGNDRLLVGGGSVAASTKDAVTVIDGGDGVDTLSADLITVGSAGQFKNFELLNLDSTTGLDLALLADNNALTGLVMSTASTSATYQNVSKDFGLTIDFVGDNSGDTNTLSFKDASGSNDTYNITFAGVSAAAADVKAGTLVASGIENYNIVSGGTKVTNSITLGTNAVAKTVTVTGAADLTLAFVGFGTAGKDGVSLIDGSAATGVLNINTTNVGAATAGLTVKTGSGNDTVTLAGKATVDTGAGNDTIVVSSAGGTITTGDGKDVVNVKAAVAGQDATVTTAVITTIADFTVGTDKLEFTNKGTEVFNATKVDVSTATALFGGSTNALDLAATGDGSTNGVISWFQYAGDTYIVYDVTADGDFKATDSVVKLTGLVDLSTLTVADFNFS